MIKSKSFLLVVLIHSLFLFQAIKHTPPIIPKLSHKIKVQTVIHVPPAPILTSAPKPPPKAPPPKPKAAAKIATPAPPKPAPVPKKILAKPPDKPKPIPDIVPPTPIKRLNIESEPDPGALAQLIAVMQETLALPEVGEVKIELTITSEGKVKELKVLSSHSELNRHYLETHLPELIFPLREKGLFQHDDQTFVFAFHSVI